MTNASAKHIARSIFFTAALHLTLSSAVAQGRARIFTRADSLRGSTISPLRTWWDVTYYNLQVKIKTADSTISGSNAMTYRVFQPPTQLQIDLMQPRRVSMRVTGMAPFEIPVTVEAMRPNLLLKNVTIQGAVQVTGYDGLGAWCVDPFVSSSKNAVDVPAAELEDFMEETDADGPLINAVAKRNRLRDIGPAVVTVVRKATPVHALELTQANGRQAIVHLHASSYLEVLRTQTRMVAGTATSMKISSDYRTVQGVREPYLTEIAIEGMAEPIRLKIDAVMLGVVMDRKEFGRS